MEVRRVVLLSVILSNLLTLECSVSLNSARTPPVNTQFALLGILKLQDYRILVPRSRLTSYLNTSETSESTGICILLSYGSRPAYEVFGVALFPSSVKHQRIVFPVPVNRRAKRWCLYYANASATFRPLIGDILFKLNPGPGTNQAVNNVRSHRSPNLAFCLLNARSLKNKTASFVDYVQDCKADFFAITETWLTQHDAVVCTEITPSGYRLLHRPRADRVGGGTALLFKDNFNVRQLAAGEKSSFEFSEYMIEASSFQFRTVIVYRIPYSAAHPITSSTFFLEFSDYLDSLLLSKVPLCISGDFNFHMDVSGDVYSAKFADLLELMCLTQHVRSPTHIQGHILDLVITRNSDNIIQGRPTSDRYISDHCSVLCSLSAPRPPPTVKHISFRKLKTLDLNALKDDIARSALSHDADPEKLADLYNNTLHLLLDRHAPMTSKRVLFRPNVPWVNNNIIEAKRQRRKAERKWRSTRCQSDLILFKKSRNYVTFLMNKARQDYYSDLISNNGNDLKHLFKVSKYLLNIASTPVLPPHDDKQQLANEMDTFFIRKIANIRSYLDNHSPQVCRVDSNDSKIDLPLSKFDLLSQEEVHDLIRISKKKTCSLDPIPTKLVLECLDILLPVITKIINYSLEHGVFPSAWKNALVFPLLKKDGLDGLQFISKLAESAVAKQLQHHISTNNLFPMLQSSYRKFHCTGSALLKVKNDILLNMNGQHVTLLVLLDLSAAFDTIDHDILVERLRSAFGVRDTALSWIASYVSGRTQQVSIDGTLSTKFDLECGVPQGSSLGPLLFVVYASKIFEIVDKHNLEIHCYADDSQLYLSFCPNNIANQEAALARVERCIEDIREWMLNDKLKLNDDKTEFIIIGTSQQLAKVSINTLRVGAATITPVSSARNLGSWFDSKLTMEIHISKTCNSAFYYLYNLRRIRKYLSKDNTKTLVHAFISSKIDYCNSLLYGLPEYQLNKLQRVQNMCARLICNESKYCHITPLLADLHWLPVKFRIEFKILLIVFKIFRGLAPSYLSFLIISKPVSQYNLRSSNDSTLLSYPKIKPKATLGERAFAFAAPKLWNALPRPIRESTSVDTFKRKLKTHLFEKAFLA